MPNIKPPFTKEQMVQFNNYQIKVPHEDTYKCWQCTSEIPLSAFANELYCVTCGYKQDWMPDLTKLEGKPPQQPSGVVHTPSTMVKIGDCTFKDYNLISWYRHVSWNLIEIFYDGTAISIEFSLSNDTKEACEKLDAILYGDYGKTEVTHSFEKWCKPPLSEESIQELNSIIPKPVNPEKLALDGLAFWCQAHNATIHADDGGITVWQGLRKIAVLSEITHTSLKGLPEGR